MASKLGLMKTVMQTNSANSGTVVFLHGSGDTGKGILEWVKFLVGDFSFPHIKFLFPTSPVRPYTALNGVASNVWFDRYDISPDVPEHAETIESIGEAVKALINKEVASGVPLNKIIVGGFSMGGALSLHMAYRFLPGLAGVFALSSFLNNESAVYRELKRSPSGAATPLLMCHGELDTLVPLSWAKDTFEKLTELNVKGEFVPLDNTLHELKEEEIRKLFDWIGTVLPNPN